MLSAKQLQIFLEQNPAVGKIIVEKSVMSQRAREAARKARDLTRRKSALDDMALPGKLADCSDKNPEKLRDLHRRGRLRRRFCEDSHVTVRHRQSFHCVVRS